MCTFDVNLEIKVYRSCFMSLFCAAINLRDFPREIYLSRITNEISLVFVGASNLIVDTSSHAIACFSKST